ncbi:hypothetical protein [Desulfobacter vibrioformis]|nr:hypothetical protein [Desulfobacter vibrioformis]
MGDANEIAGLLASESANPAYLRPILARPEPDRTGQILSPAHSLLYTSYQ